MNIKNPCNRICKINEKNICEGCGRTWDQVRYWNIYTNDKKSEVLYKLKDFKPNLPNKFTD